MPGPTGHPHCVVIMGEMCVNLTLHIEGYSAETHSLSSNQKRISSCNCHWSLGRKAMARIASPRRSNHVNYILLSCAIVSLTILFNYFSLTKSQKSVNLVERAALRGQAGIEIPAPAWCGEGRSVFANFSSSTVGCPKSI